MSRLALALSVLLLTTGCEKIQEKLAQKAAEKAVESASGGEVNVDTANGAVTVTDKKTGTTVQSGASVKLPDGWPASVPVYPGATVRSAMTTPGGKSATLATKDSAAKVGEFYKTRSGLKVESDLDLGGQRIVMLKQGKSTVSVIVGQAGDETTVTVTIAD